LTDHERSAAEWAADVRRQVDAKTEGSRRDKTVSNEPPADGEKAALIKVMKDAVAARHGGVSPKTMTPEDAEVAAQAAIKWKKKQAAEKAKRDLAVLKVKPPPSNGDGEIYSVKELIKKSMREPSSAVFGDVIFVNDRKSPTGYYAPVVCGTVNGRNGFGGMTGQKHFFAIASGEIGAAVYMEDTTSHDAFASEWNRYCAGPH
jgi:hypothetical protein